MLNQNLFASVREPLTTARTVSVFLPPNPSLDKLAAGLALFLSLKKANRQVAIVCPTAMTVEFSHLFGVDQIKDKPQGQNLIISFDYLEDSIEKVSYHIENNKFNLVIQPKEGFPPLSKDKVNYLYSGGTIDLAFVIGVRELEELGKIAQKFLVKEKVVNIDAYPDNSQFGRVNLVDPTSTSCSEIVVQLISQLGLPIDADIATNLLSGLEKASQKFTSPRVNASTFEAAAFCLRSGARRMKSSRRLSRKKPPLKPMSTKVSAVKRPEEPVAKTKPSPDWFEPKIYKGNTRI